MVDKAFYYFTPEEYDLIKAHKSFKAINAYTSQYTLIKEEQLFWLELAIKNNKRIENLEKENLEFIKSMDTEFAYEVLMRNEYIDNVVYSNKEQKSLKYYKKIATNDFPYLEDLVFKNSLIEPYALRMFYTNTKIDPLSIVLKHVIKIHSICPTFYSTFILDKHHTKKTLRGSVDKI